MSDAYYMIPVESAAHVYYMTPVESGADAYYMIPVGSSDAGWMKIETITWIAAIHASPFFNGSPGDYSGAQKRVLPAYDQVKIRAIDGVWRDSAAMDAFCGSLGFKTRDRLVTLGPGSCLDDAGSGTYTTEDEARGNWMGQELEFTLGADKTIAWGFFDNVLSNNGGSLTFEMWAK